MAGACDKAAGMQYSEHHVEVAAVQLYKYDSTKSSHKRLYALFVESCVGKRSIYAPHALQCYQRERERERAIVGRVIRHVHGVLGLRMIRTAHDQDYA
eukprot:1156248-Pelagomonas_calceolata.AAC.16